MQTPLPQFSSHFYNRCAHAQCCIEWKINFPISIFFELWLIVFKIYGWHTGTFQVGHQPKKKSFKNGQINRKDEQWAETKKKSIFWFFFWQMIEFVPKKIDQFWALSQLRICRPLHPSVLIRCLWMMRSVLNRIKKISESYFSSYRENSSKIGVMTSQKWP